jgi:hypothetical protein
VQSLQVSSVAYLRKGSPPPPAAMFPLSRGERLNVKRIGEISVGDPDQA